MAVTLNPVSYLPPRLSGPEVHFPAGRTGVKFLPHSPLLSWSLLHRLVSTGLVSICSTSKCNRKEVKDSKRPALQKRKIVDSSRSHPGRNRIRTRYQGRWAYGAGQDHRTHSAKFLAAKNERTNHRFRQKLPGMSKELSGLPPTLWPVLTSGTSVCTMAVNCDEFHYRTSTLGGV